MNDFRLSLLVLSAPGGAEEAEAIAGDVGPHTRRELDTDASAGGAARIATALLTAERAILDTSPGAVLLGGGGPEVAAAALVAVKLGVPQARLGAGMRRGVRRDAREGELAVADRLCDLLLCANAADMANLEREGLGARARVVGDARTDPRPAVAAIRAWLDTYTSGA